MREIKEIIVHCSDTNFGSAALIDEWHKSRGWRGIGYHFVILNGIRTRDGEYSARFDGSVERGRSVDHAGAHCRGHNENSIGICLIGIRSFTPIQLFQSLPDLLELLIGRYRVTLGDIAGHYEYDGTKICPGFDLPRYLRNLKKLGRF